MIPFSINLNMKNKINIYFILFASLAKAQSIVNTENMSSKLDSTFVLTRSFDELKKVLSFYNLNIV